MKKILTLLIALVLIVVFSSFAQSQTSLVKCNSAADCYKAGAKFCSCNGPYSPSASPEKSYCIDKEDWRVNYYHCSSGVSTENLTQKYCVLSAATSSQKDSYTCDNGQSVWNNVYENGVWAGGADSCLDGKDNDYDGTIDCSDSDCSQTSSCLTCENGQTAVGQCSFNQKGKYCQSRNNLVDKCSNCGCQSGYYCNSQDSCVKDNPPTIVADVKTSGQYGGSNQYYS